MTVAELIEQLKTYPPYLDVVVMPEHSNGYYVKKDVGITSLVVAMDPKDPESECYDYAYNDAGQADSISDKEFEDTHGFKRADSRRAIVLLDAAC